MARTFFPEGAPAQVAASILCESVSDDRVKWGVLQDADAGSRQDLARADGERFRLRLEGIEVHHPLEALVGEFRQQSRIAGRPTVSFRKQGWSDPFPASTELQSRRRPAENIFQIVVR